MAAVYENVRFTAYLFRSTGYNGGDAIGSDVDGITGIGGDVTGCHAIVLRAGVGNGSSEGRRTDPTRRRERKPTPC